MSGSAALRAGLISQSQVPVKFRPIKAVTDTTTITTGVAQNDIPAQQVIVNGLFAVPGSTGGTAAQLIPKGDVAISISVDQVHGVAGLVEPGDNVDMLVQVSPGSGSANSREAYLYQDVPVLAVGSATTSPGAAPASGAAAQAQPSGIYTFAVPPPAAARIAMAQSGAGGVTGSIYLALVPPGNAANTQVPISSQNLLPSNPTPR